jgi:hypothetical protein
LQNHCRLPPHISSLSPAYKLCQEKLVAGSFNDRRLAFPPGTIILKQIQAMIHNGLQLAEQLKKFNKLLEMTLNWNTGDFCI